MVWCLAVNLVVPFWSTLAVAALGDRDTDRSLIADIEAAVQSSINCGHIPGLALSVVHDQRVLIERG